MWSSHLTFEKDVSALEPSDLWQIAYDAYAEMEINRALYKVTGPKSTPRAMTVLAVGKEIFLASSMRGGSNFAFVYPKTKVSTILEQCQATFHKNGGTSTTGHKNQASCGEVMTAQLYYTTEKNKDTPLQDREARVCTVVRNKEDVPANTNPCDSLQTWGCNLFVKELGVKVVDKRVQAKPFDLVEKMGKPVIDQIPLCAADYKPPNEDA
ncbi:hypothetical protein N7535_009201 [Penicillium sp. DV-2018c]|nr:hypothetical protein N7535_009201 [Penicillium sp. DV-2018c]